MSWLRSISISTISQTMKNNWVIPITWLEYLSDSTISFILLHLQRIFNYSNIICGLTERNFNYLKIFRNDKNPCHRSPVFRRVRGTFSLFQSHFCNVRNFFVDFEVVQSKFYESLRENKQRQNKYFKKIHPELQLAIVIVYCFKYRRTTRQSLVKVSIIFLKLICLVNCFWINLNYAPSWLGLDILC